ncbi:enhancer of mRNA-decapping protein 3-like isoform X2, partial [Argonauta hians]
MSGYVGCIVSLDCGDLLGNYQGQVKSVNNSNQTITIDNCFRNGIACEHPKITISAGDIRELSILKSAEDARDILSIQSTPSKFTKEQMEAICGGTASPVKVVSCNDHYNQSRTPNKDKNSQYNNGNHRRTPTNKDDHLKQRRNSASEPRKKTPARKIDCRRKLMTREDCFSAPSESFLKEFDFEKNLALFDKKAFFQEMENSLPEILHNNDRKNPAKYRHDENILESGPVVLCKIKVPCYSEQEYVTDSGLNVPSISYELRSRLFSAGEEFGFSKSRQLETVGRSTTEMILQFLGGSQRLNPKNDHQLPTVVVLCGPHIQGAQGITCARLLANHNVKTYIYVPNYMKMDHIIEKELALYDLTDGIKTFSLKDLPKFPVDIIVNSLDNHENMVLRDQSWYQSLVVWANSSKAPVLAIDPPQQGSLIHAKWSLSLCLPLNLKGNFGQVYLCDVGLPRKVMAHVGITYSSPFGHKFLIPLHAKT